MATLDLEDKVLVFHTDTKIIPLPYVMSSLFYFFGKKKKIVRRWLLRNGTKDKIEEILHI